MFCARSYSVARKELHGQKFCVSQHTHDDVIEIMGDAAGKSLWTLLSP
jgi:hypothetical protein